MSHKVKFAAVLSVVLAISAFACGSGEAEAVEAAAGNGCDVNVPAMPAPLAVVPSAAFHEGPSGNTASSGTPVQVMGCVDREYALRRVVLHDAEAAVALKDAPLSRGAVFRFQSRETRDALIAAWLNEGAPAEYVPGKASTFYIADWANSHWSRPDGIVIHAMHPEMARSGKMCLVRADTRAIPEALPILNNWCMDRLDLWAD